MDAYEQLEGRYGVFISALETLRYEGRLGEELMRAKMDALREAKDIAGLKILEKTDYLRDDGDCPAATCCASAWRAAGGEGGIPPLGRNRC